MKKILTSILILLTVQSVVYAYSCEERFEQVKLTDNYAKAIKKYKINLALYDAYFATKKFKYAVLYEFKKVEECGSSYRGDKQKNIFKMLEKELLILNAPPSQEEVKSANDLALKYIEFVKSTKEKIPVLPWDSLKNEEFRKYLLCSLGSAKKSLAMELIELNKNFNKKTFSNGFEKRKAKEIHKAKKQDMLDKASSQCSQKIVPPVFYANIIVPVTDEYYDNNINLSLYEHEIEANNERSNFGSLAALGYEDIRLLQGTQEIRVTNKSPKTAIPMSIEMLEKLFLSSENYKGEKRKFKGKKEIKGKMYYSLAEGFSADFRKSPKFTFWLYPEYYEVMEHKGTYSSFKPWQRKDRNYNDRSQYVFFN